MSLPNSTLARDVEYHLHPVTDARSLEETGPIIIERGFVRAHEHGLIVEDMVARLAAPFAGVAGAA